MKTASERLRELATAWESGDWHTRLTPVEALDALPLIADVVEAAQGCTDWHRPEGNFIRLDSALTALCDALEEK